MAYGAYAQSAPLVYRVELECGDGPFSRTDGASRAHGRAMEKHGYCPDPFGPPGPHEDIPGWSALYNRDAHRAYCFGFSSLPQLKAWFHCVHVRKELHLIGFDVSVYEANASQVLTGRRQVAFIKGRKVNRISMMEV